MPGSASHILMRPAASDISVCCTQEAHRLALILRALGVQNRGKAATNMVQIPSLHALHIPGLVQPTRELQDRIHPKVLPFAY